MATGKEPYSEALTEEAKSAIRTYMFGIFTVAGPIVAIVAGVAGYMINDLAKAQATTEALQKIQQPLIDANLKVSEALGNANALKETSNQLAKQIADLNRKIADFEKRSNPDTIISRVAADIVNSHGAEIIEPIENAVWSQTGRAVVAFDRECPDGWSSYYPAAGRFVIGAGPHSADAEGQKNRDQNGVDLTVYDPPGELPAELLREPSAANLDGKKRTGGEEKHTLTVEEMPPHKHDVALSSEEGSKTGTGIRSAPNNANGGVNERVLVSGSNQPHNNLPPYIALYFCQKDG